MTGNARDSSGSGVNDPQEYVNNEGFKVLNFFDSEK